jgi:hypothetical protein
LKGAQIMTEAIRKSTREATRDQILAALAGGPLYPFGIVPGMSPGVLSFALLDLERDGLVTHENHVYRLATAEDVAMNDINKLET